MEPYILEDLKKLNLNDTVFITFDDFTDKFKSDAFVCSKDVEYIYFECDYGVYDFPINDTTELSHRNKQGELLTIQDTGDYIFKVYKIK